jgi:hypothetical protein
VKHLEIKEKLPLLSLAFYHIYFLFLSMSTEEEEEKKKAATILRISFNHRLIFFY